MKCHLVKPSFPLKMNVEICQPHEIHDGLVLVQTNGGVEKLSQII